MLQTLQPTTAAPSYESDFYAWLQHQANLLRDEVFEQLDLPNLIEEIEAMARRERRERISRLTVLLTHLLKWQIQTEIRSRGWQTTIRIQRHEIEDLLADSPSLRTLLDQSIDTAYPRARIKAIEETGLLFPAFPGVCPFTSQQLLDNDFFPNG
jgi:hypothetical protein